MIIIQNIELKIEYVKKTFYIITYRKMEKVYIVLEQFLDDDECQNVYTFSSKEKAIAYSQNRIDYFLDIDTSHCDFSLNYCQGFLFIPGNVCIRVLENQVDIMKTDRKPYLKPNCLAK